MSSEKLVNPSAERNKGPILEVIKQYFRTSAPGNVLEIASGTGQHVTHFAPHFPNLTFQPSEFSKSMVNHIQTWIKDCPTKNIKNALHIDVSTPVESWGLADKEYDYMININMIHISPYVCTEGLFESASKLLKLGGLMVTYGVYAMNGVLTPESNVKFNQMLRCQNPEWGARDIVVLKELAKKNGINLIQIHDMPANNKCLIWKKLSIVCKYL